MQPVTRIRERNDSKERLTTLSYFYHSIHYDSDVKTSRDTTAIGRGRGRGERGRGAGAIRGARGGAKNAALVQTSGLFSEGTGEQRLRKSSGMMQFALILMFV